MENFRIDFTLSDPFPDGKRIGEIGEKNAAQLIITPPENLASREEIKSYIVAFSTEKGPVRIGPFHKAEMLTIPVNNALTVGTALSVQLEGYDADGEFIIKSPVLSGIMISNSIGDCETSDGSQDSVIPGHLHDNLDTLDSFSEESGVLTYKGSEVFSAIKIKTVVLTSLYDSFSAFADMPLSGCFTVLAGEDSDGNPYVPEGSEIVSVEVNIASKENPEWVDLRNMSSAESFVPYVVNLHRAFYSDFLNGMVIATVFFPAEKNIFYDAISNYILYGVRVKYIAESEEAE